MTLRACEPIGSRLLLLHVIVWNFQQLSQNVLRDFSTQLQKNKTGGNNERVNDWTPGKKTRSDTTRASIYSTLYIYAIVYVWIWRIWKYMLTNLYRVFYVMWNTWSRCSLLYLPLLLCYFSSFLFFFFFFLLVLFSIINITGHIKRTGPTLC